MTVPELAERFAPVPTGNRPAQRMRGRSLGAPILLLALTALGAVIRLVVAHQSLFGDELSTYWIVATHGLHGVLSLLYGTASFHHAEISPPLSFVASWVTVQFGHTPELLRAPSLLAGVASIPLVFALGRRTVGRRAAWLAAALTTLSPFMVYYSTEARAYALMMAFTIGSTLSLLSAIDTGRRRWWVAYGVCACAAFYSHYTCGFVLVVQGLWALWTHPAQRRPFLIASAGALVGLLPWAPGFINDLHSPTTKLLSALSPFSPHYILLYLRHWAFGYPYLGVSAVPGPVALAAVVAALVLAAVAVLRRMAPAPRRLTLAHLIEHRVVLLIALVLATPIGEALISASGNHIFGTRNLAASWPPLVLVAAALLSAPGPRVRAISVALAVGAFAIASAEVMFVGRYHRPDTQSAAAFVTARAHPGDVIIDDTGALVTPGPPTPLDVALSTRLPVFRAGVPAERSLPFGFGDPVVPFAQAVQQAVAAAGPRGRIFLVQALYPALVAGVPEPARATTGAMPAGYSLAATQRYPGILAIRVAEYAPRR